MDSSDECSRYCATPDEEKNSDNNQARIAKIWGAYNREFVYKTCRVDAIEYKVIV